MSEVKAGYKQTELGVIPVDWEVEKLKDVFSITAGGDLVKDKFSPIRDDKHSYPIYSNALTDKGIYGYSEDYQYDENCITVTARGSIGTANFRNGKFNAIGRLLILKPNNDCDCFFISEFINQRVKFSVESTGVPQLTAPQISNYQIALPPTKAEQTAIATVLSDADALIGSLEKLVAKKRNIKQGTMQLLLTGKKRLPGFSGKWEVKKLPKVVWFQEGPGVRNSQFTNSGVKLLNGTNIEDGKLLLEKTDRYISEKEAFGWYSHFLVGDGDILIACSGVTIDKFQEKVTIAAQVHLPLCMNTSTMRFKIVSSILSKDFFFHFLKSKSFKEQIGGKATGSAQLNFGPSHVKMVEISLPKPKEQTAIANILSDMDAEITALEAKLEKYKMVKQGMMQELLTGKTRLI